MAAGASTSSRISAPSLSSSAAIASGPAWAGGGLVSEYAAEDRLHLGEMPGRGEQLGQLGVGQRRGDLRVGFQEVEEHALAAPDPHRVALNGGVGAFAGEPLLGQRQQYALRMHQAAELAEVARHVLR